MNNFFGQESDWIFTHNVFFRHRKIKKEVNAMIIETVLAPVIITAAVIEALRYEGGKSDDGKCNEGD
jgi:hypothetical protein